MCTANTIQNLRKKTPNNSKKRKMMFVPPGPKDILCGRGNVYANHEGNRYFGRVIRSNIDEYQQASNRPEKVRVVNDILKKIQSTGVRFAKIDRETKQWYELEAVQAHQKIGHAIRDTIRLLKGKTNDKDKHTKQSIVAKRKRKPIPVMPPKSKPKSTPYMLPKPSTKPFLTRQLSSGVAEFLKDILGDHEDIQETTHDLRNEFEESVFENPPIQHSYQRSTSIGGPMLDGEYPEESFDFSATSFFGDQYGARPHTIISQ